MSAPLPLFAFGTLRSGQCNHDLLRGRYERRLQARLWGYQIVAPLTIARDETGWVVGELFFFAPEVVDDVMAACDKLEGIPAGELRGSRYQRIEVTVDTQEGQFTAWAYVRSE